MPPEHHSAHQPRPQHWYRSGFLIFGLIIASIFSLVFTLVTTANERAMKPSQLIMKPAGCHFLQQNGIEPQLVLTESAQGCTLNVQYIPSMQKDSGIIVMGEKELRMADEQVGFVGALENQPRTPAQFRWAMMITAHIVFLIVLLIRLFRLAC